MLDVRLPPACISRSQDICEGLLAFEKREFLLTFYGDARTLGEDALPAAGGQLGTGAKSFTALVLSIRPEVRPVSLTGGSSKLALPVSPPLACL